MDAPDSWKVKDVQSGSAARRYFEVQYGDVSRARAILCELITMLAGSCPGALGLFLRLKLYPLLFPAIGKGVIFGRNVVLRQPHKIRIGNGAIIDDNVVLDAKGTDNEGIVIGDRVYIGRNTIIYCKNGNIRIGDRANISSNCQIFSANALEIGEDTVIGAFTYVLSGGEYDYLDPTPFSRQSGMRTKGPTRIGPDCWLGAHVTVLDGVVLGKRTVVAAGAVVNRSFDGSMVIGGVPARVLKDLRTLGPA